jgi:hypothetical protein
MGAAYSDADVLYYTLFRGFEPLHAAIAGGWQKVGSANRCLL